MKYLQALNWVLFAAGLLMAVVMGVVSLILMIYYEGASEIGSNIPRVFLVWGAFSGFAVVSGLSSWALYKRHALMWTGQGALAAGLVMMVLLFQNLNQL